MSVRSQRALSWAVAVLATGFIAWAVPLRDVCWDRGAPHSTRAALTRTASGCVLHLHSGEVTIGRDECESLACEPGLISTLEHTRMAAVGGLTIVYALGTLAWAARWRALLGFTGVDLSLSQVWRTVVEAQAGGVMLPGGIGGDALRIASVVTRPTLPGQARAPASIVVASVLLDRVVGLSLIAALAAGLGFGWGGVHAGPLAVVLAGIPAASVAAWIALRRPSIGRSQWLTESRVGRLVSPVLGYVRDPRATRAVLRAGAVGLVVAVVQFVCIRGLVFAVGATPTQEKWVYVGTAMAFIVAAVPALPGAWGTADAAYVYFFGLAGIAPSAALGVCLLYRMFWYGCGLVGAALHMTRKHAAEAKAPEAAAPLDGT